MRTTATITMYVYGENEQECFNQAELIAKNLKNHYDNQASVEHLHNTPFGTLCFDNSNEIDLNTLKKFNESEIKPYKRLIMNDIKRSIDFSKDL